MTLLMTISTNAVPRKSVASHHVCRPDNATVVLAGDFSTEDAVRMAGEYFGGIPRPARPVQRINVTEPQQRAERRVTKSYANSPLPALFAGLAITLAWYKEAGWLQY